MTRKAKVPATKSDEILSSLSAPHGKGEIVETISELALDLAKYDISGAITRKGKVTKVVKLYQHDLPMLSTFPAEYKKAMMTQLGIPVDVPVKQLSPEQQKQLVSVNTNYFSPVKRIISAVTDKVGPIPVLKLLESPASFQAVVDAMPSSGKGRKKGEKPGAQLPDGSDAGDTESPEQASKVVKVDKAEVKLPAGMTLRQAIIGWMGSMTPDALCDLVQAAASILKGNNSKACHDLSELLEKALSRYDAITGGVPEPQKVRKQA